MRKLILATLMAAVAVPTMALPGVASAQSYRGHQDRGHQSDRHDGRHDDRNDGRHDNDRNHRWGDNDWRGWRDHNRALFARGHWRAPFRYQHFRPGVRIARDYWGPRYRISDPWRYRLPAAGVGRYWVRHYDDVLLVDARRGIVIRVIPSFWY